MCEHDPRETTGPIGMYHCPDCGEMVVAGMEHPNYLLLENKESVRVPKYLLDQLMELVLVEMRVLGSDRRLQVFSNFCHSCGGDNPSCQCMNNE